MCCWVSDLACCHFAYAHTRTPLFITLRMRNTENSIHTPTSRGPCVSIGDRAIWFSDYYLFSLHPVSESVCACEYSSFAHVRTTPQPGDFCVVLCFVTFGPFLSLNSSLADNSVVSLVPYVYVVLGVFYLVKIGFQPEPNRFNNNRPSFL